MVKHTEKYMIILYLFIKLEASGYFDNISEYTSEFPFMCVCTVFLFTVGHEKYNLCRILSIASGTTFHKVENNFIT